MANNKPKRENKGSRPDRRSKGSRFYGKDKDKEQEDKVFRRNDNPFNDFSWYNAHPELLKAASMIPFPYRPGMLVPAASKVSVSGSTVTTTNLQLAYPGVWGITWLPFIGTDQTVTSPASIAAKELYAKVRSVFSGSIEADPPDFMIYLLALDNIFCYIAHLKRIYRIVSTYSPDNLIMPEGLLQNLGFTASQITDLVAGKTTLWQYINELISMTRKFRCPAVFPLMNRHYWMNDNVFADANYINSQFYVFSQLGFGIFSMEENSDGVEVGGLKFGYPDLTSGTVSGLFSFGRSMIDALASSDDAYVISGYLMRAYEGTPNFAVDTLLQGEIFTPVYVPEVLEQIRNCHCVRMGTTGTPNYVQSYKILQNPATNTVYSTPTSANIDNMTSVPLVNAYMDLESINPTTEQIVEATRLQSFLVKRGSDASATADIVAATELVMGFVITVPSQTGSSKFRDLTLFSEVVTSAAIETYAVVSNFHMRPRIFFQNTNGFYSVGDFRNFTTFTTEQLKEIHKVCLYSELNSFN